MIAVITTLLSLLVIALAMASVLLDWQRSGERERVKTLEAEAQLRQAKYLAILREKTLIERELEATRGELEATRLMLGDTTRALFRKEARHG